MSQVLAVTLNPAIDQTVELTALSAGAVNRALSTAFNAGGKGINVASVLADWGTSALVTGLLGRENASVFDALFEHPLIIDEMRRVAGKTRTNIKLLARDNSTTTDINLPGFSAERQDLDQVCEVLTAHCQPGDWVVLAGSLPQGMANDSWLELCALVRRLGANALLDTSGVPLAHVLKSGAESQPYAIKPNREELSEWAGRALTTREDVLQAARGLLSQGIQLVVVSMGSEGALLVRDGDALLALPPKFEGGSSVGAGDAMVAGLVSGLMDDLPLAALAHRATGFAVAKLNQLGPHLPERAHVETLIATTRIETL